MRDYDSLFSDLLSDLALETVVGEDCYLTDSSVDHVSRVSLAASFYKKLCPEGTNKHADEAALKKFLAINGSLQKGTFDFAASNEAESCFWDYFREGVATVTDQRPFGQSFDLDFIREHMAVGPGASQKADSTSMVTKLCGGTLSYTDPELVDLYRAALAGTGSWCEAEMLRAASHGFLRVEGGKLFFAAKNREISRTCCTEPLLNMLIQKAIGAFLEQGLERDFGINLSTQPDLNRELARVGSLGWEGDDPFCTIDLVSASDCMAWCLIQRVIENPVLARAIRISRCQRVVLPDGTKTELSMVSTMGNGFTFPLQTLLFACAVRACYQLMGIPMTVRGAKNFAVFGDDIVVRRRAYPFLCRMLAKLGFSVNERKSFSTGPFRESCGHDYFAGTNVRGVYVKSLETPQEVVSVVNRLNRWSAHTGIELPKTIARLMEWAPKMLVPPSEADDAGIHVPFELTKPKLTPEYWFKYRAFRKRIAKVDIVEEPACEGQLDDPEPCITRLESGALAVGFLSGTYRRRDTVFSTSWHDPWEGGWPVSVSVRERPGVRSRYNVINKSIPYWDYLLPAKLAEAQFESGPWCLRPTPESFGRWKTVVANGLRR